MLMPISVSFAGFCLVSSFQICKRVGAVTNTGSNTTNSRAASAVSFRTSIHVGDTYYTAEELEDLIAHMGREYLGRRYHLLQTNCNSFSSDASFALCGERPPGWINRLAGVAMAVHCVCPTSWVPPLQPPSMMPNFDGMPTASALGTSKVP